MLLSVVAWIRSVPHGHLSVCSPPWPVLLLWYAVLAAFVIKSRPYRLFVSVAMVAVLGYAGWSAVHEDRVQIDCLTPWRGSVAFINVPGEADMLLDSGPSKYSSRVLKHLRKCGVDELGILVLTHADADHVGGALDILQSLPVRELWCSDYKGRSPVFRKVLRQARDKGVKIRVLKAGDHGVLSGGVVWEVFHPKPEGKYSCADDASLVIRLARGRVGVLFMGGAGGTAEAVMCKGDQEPSASVLVQGSHRGRRACTAAWLDVVEPRWVIIGAPAFSETRESDVQRFQRFAEREIDVWNMAEDGAVRLQWKKGQSALSILPLAR